MEIFKKTYDGESIVDMDRDISEALDSDYNPAAALIQLDDCNIPKGKFTVIISYEVEDGL